MTRYLAFLLVSIAMLLPSCSGGMVDPEKAVALGDLFMNDVINDRRDEIYSKMESEFHDFSSRDQLAIVLDSLYEEVGKPSSFRLSG